MKICVVIFVLNLINSCWTSSEDNFVPFKGTIDTIVFSESTTSITLNCTCANELIQWRANRSFCKAFFRDVTYPSNNSLCKFCSREALTLYPPFVKGTYLCIGSGGGNPCFHRWYLDIKNSSFPTTSTPYKQKQVNYLPYIGLLAFVLLLIANYLLVYNLHTYY